MLDVDSGDVIKLILQHLDENGLTEAKRALESESKITLNTVPDKDGFANDVKGGRWDKVLRQVSKFSIPQSKLFALYEHIVLEMIEVKEIDTAKALMVRTEAMALMKHEDPERFLRLKRFLTSPRFDAAAAYRKDRKTLRLELAKILCAEVTVAPPSRLLAMIQQGLKWQQFKGRLKLITRKRRSGSEENVSRKKKRTYDLFVGAEKRKKREPETFPRRQVGEIRFGSENHPESVLFSPNGEYVVTGSADGFVEIWDFETCKHKREMKYQANEEFMMADDSVLSMAFSGDSELLATGSKDGSVRVFRVSSGKCLRRLRTAHSKGVTGVTFSMEGSQLATCSYDSTARIHGLKSAKTLREFRGHDGYVNDVAYGGGDGSLLFTAGSDGTVKVWNARTAEMLRTMRPPQRSALAEISVSRVIPLPRSLDQVVVCNRSSSVYIMTVQGRLVSSLTSSTMSSENKNGTTSTSRDEFISCAVSPKGQWIYCMTEDARVYCFDAHSSELKHVLESTHKKRGIGIAHHPYENRIVTYAHDGFLRLWRP